MKSVAEQNLKFEVKSINSERSPYGMTTIVAIEKETEVYVQAVVPNCSKSDKKYIREQFIIQYKSKVKDSVKIENEVQLGEIL